MGFLKRARKAVKKVARPVTRVTERALKPIARPLRPIVSKAIPFIPMTAPLALGVKAKAFGIRSERGVASYKRSQKVARIGTAAAAVVGGAIVAAPAVAGVVGGIGLPSAGTLLGAGSAALPLLGGGGPTEDTAWNPEGEMGRIGDAIRHDREAAEFRRIVSAGFVGPAPSDYAPSPAWPWRPDAATGPAPSGASPVMALVGLVVGLYLLTKGG